MLKPVIVASLMTACSAAWCGSIEEKIGDWGKATLTLNQKPYYLYVADNDSKRQQGLMGVSLMQPDRGVLFVFDKPSRQCMWMKNTLIPLTVLYLDEDGRFLSASDLIPHDETPKCSQGNAKYAVEVLQGSLPAKSVEASISN